MNYNEWLRTAENQMAAAGIISSRLDSILLLERATKHNRAWLLAHLEATLSDAQFLQLSGELTRRLAHEPMSYIHGFKEFYGREFYVSPKVLEPRPETEDMIDLLKALGPAKAHVADIGTGSGALAITAALEADCMVAATDIDSACLLVAERNATLHNASVQFMTGSLLEPFLQKSCNFKPDVLLANLPYVPDDYPINEAAKHEPSIALFGGSDGLDLYRAMFAQTQQLHAKPALVLCESLLTQHSALAAIAKDNGYSLTETRGLIQAFSAIN